MQAHYEAVDSREVGTDAIDLTVILCAYAVTANAI